MALGEPRMCKPDLGFAIRPQMASYSRGCTLPWTSVLRALRLVRWWREGAKSKSAGQTGVSAESLASPEGRYANGAWLTKTMVAYPDEEQGAAS